MRSWLAEIISLRLCRASSLTDWLWWLRWARRSCQAEGLGVSGWEWVDEVGCVLLSMRGCGVRLGLLCLW